MGWPLDRFLNKEYFVHIDDACYFSVGCKYVLLYVNIEINTK